MLSQYEVLLEEDYEVPELLLCIREMFLHLYDAPVLGGWYLTGFTDAVQGKAWDYNGDEDMDSYDDYHGGYYDALCMIGGDFC